MTAVTPPISAIPEPAAPRLGPKFDDNGPYLRRRSSRLKSTRTPSPGHEKTSNRASKHQSRNYQAHRNLSPSSSPISPNLSLPKRKSKREIQKSDQDSISRRAPPDTVHQMLLTPIKTPAKKDTKRVVKTTSRVVFPSSHLSNNMEDIMPKRSRISAYSPGSAPEVRVYRDANAQTPEVDKSEENVFYELPHKRSARAKARSDAMEATEQKREQLEQIHDREKGMWFTFRGKKIWREYQDDDQDDSEPPNTIDAVQQRKVTPPPRFMKIAHKPRTLFPDVYKKGDTTDEEAVTDIEHPEKYGSLFVEKEAEKPVSTPAKQRFYATPPTTVRTTRSTARRPADTESLDLNGLSTSLFTVKKGGRRSHFDEWNRGIDGDSGGGSQEKKRKANGGLNHDQSKRAKSDVSD